MSRGTLDHTSSFLVSTTGLLPSMAELSNSLHLRYCIHVVCPQPQRSKLHWFGLFRVRSPLLTESNFFLFLQVLRCFSSLGSLETSYVFRSLIPSLDNRKSKTSRSGCHQDHKILEFRLSKVGFPIRKSMDQSLFAAPHGLSQRSTSFIASQRQGIHRTPLRHLIALIINVHTLGRMLAAVASCHE